MKRAVWAVLRLAAKKPLRFLLGIAVFIAIFIAAVALGTCGARDAGDAVGLESGVEDGTKLKPRAILSRLWLDKLPDNRREDYKLMIFLGGGIGFFERGSSYRGQYEIFEFERQGDRLVVEYLQSKKKVESTFEIVRCDEKPPFDLCLTLQTPIKGTTKLYGFAYDDDVDDNMPWGRALKRSVEERARSVR